MPATNTGNFSKAMLPGVHIWFGIDYDDFQKFTPAMFDVVKSEKLYEEVVSAVGPALLREKAEGAGIEYDNIQQGYVSRVYNKTYALGLQYTEEVIEDNQYRSNGLAILSKEAGRYLGRAAAKTEETLAGNFFNNMFTANGGDGVAMISASHPTIKGGTYSNTPSVQADISEVALEQALIDIKRLKDDAGKIIQLMGKSIIIPPELEFEVSRILKSTSQNDTANNATNALKSMGAFPGGVTVNPYLTGTKAWFVRTDVASEKGLICFDRIAPTPSDDNSFETGNAKFKIRFRKSFLLADPRAIYGSNP
jgi:hypothetical protein